MTLRRSRPPVLGSRAPQANNRLHRSVRSANTPIAPQVHNVQHHRSAHRPRRGNQRNNNRDGASSKRPEWSEQASSWEKQALKERQQSPKPTLPAKKAVVAALQQLQPLTTRTPESAIGIEPNEGGWRVTVEVVESALIPDTADIMAEYVVDIASDGDLTS